MKKLSILASLAVAAVILTGCGGGSTYYVEDVPPVDDGATTLFLIDQDGYSLGGVPYICDSMVDWSATRPNGEFTFFPPDNCTFDFLGYYGNYENDYEIDDIIYIVDDIDRGKGDIPYDCEFFGASTTYGDGSFDYDEDDICTFYL
ncbi:MAG: hypothetical protein U9Q90_03615 [Campylobacterota bacterium]|nr:hypothetical protein [Campylobacterota bacterium]